MSSVKTVQSDSPAVQSYLSILQDIITRMANNSSNCKTWCITIVSAILVVIVDKKQPSYVWLALFPIFLFFFLDAYYLAQERGFRDIYTHFVHKLHSDSATSQDLFVIKAPKGWPLCKTMFASAFSVAIAPFYGILTFTAFIANSFIMKP